MEYVYAEPNDQGTCTGATNATAVIDEIFLSQTHRHAIGHPFLFTIGERPAFFQVALSGSGASPDVQVEGTLNGNSLGTLCLKGPANLSPSIDLTQPNMDDYFSVTLPKSWVEIGLELTITAGNETRALTQSDLKVRPYTELNLVNVDMDIMDYNHLPHRTPIFDDFLEELASAVPVSMVRFGQFPEALKIPVMAANNWQGVPAVVSFDAELAESPLDRGLLNAAAQSVLSKIQIATGDFPNTIFFGNTLNLDPGGWGSEGHFVSFEYTDVFIHELGHAFSLPHWEWEYELANPEDDQHNYPYSGETGSGGGRGEAWNFIQDSYEFVSPYCEDESGVQGLERSDAMQREHPCVGIRPSGPAPWDGYGDFTVNAISNFLLGSEVETGQVAYRGNMVDYQFKDNPGYPRVILENGERAFTREASQPQNTFVEDLMKLPGTEAIEQTVFMISGSAHANDLTFNVIYEPIKYTGTLLPVIDPTDPTIFAVLQDLELDEAPQLYDQERDLTLKLTYIDGTVKHVLVPFQTSDRTNLAAPNDPVSLEFFSVVVPGDQALCNVQLYRREFLISDADNSTPGNINDPAQNINAANFMDGAVLMTTLDYSCNCPGSPGYIEPGTPCDDGNPYTVNDVEDGFCNCAGTVIPSCGKITNSAFTQTLVGWRNWGSEVTTINDEAAFTILSPGDAGFGFDLMEFLSGETYTVKFEAYALENRPLNVIHRAEYDFENDREGTEFLKTTFNITTTKTEYEATFTVTEDSNSSLLEFNFSGSDIGVFLDNVCLELTCGDEEIPSNGLDDDCDPSTADDVTTSVDVLLEENAISLFPNPTTGIFEISGPDDNYLIRILTAEGAVVQTIEYPGNSHNIDISQLPAGLLFIEISNEQHAPVCLKKIIKR